MKSTLINQMEMDGIFQQRTTKHDYIKYPLAIKFYRK
jgi:hypothetical protein